ncbi:NAD(P)-dependent alcohol dehydrogenase [Flavisphingomonas formosensis]|uniref:NAD(P)-dependent alcohol dehydrogenase n=1 Tax=Flavisphingomonas formosensis TaxID=861534 RepID=UPI0012FB8A1F|nr:NAD(P)-dependent alcohol dehydrogenase [Sphingomonas formosensis]
MKIRAAVAREAHGEFTVEDIELVEPRPDEILVRLVATGICHTDLAIVEQIMPLPLPYVLGHEGAGIVERVGDSVSGFAPGDPVVLTFNTCGTCAPCIDAHPAYCQNYPLLNFYTRRPDGSATLQDAAGAPLGGAFFGQSSFATYALSSTRNTIKVRKDAPLALLGPLGCGLSTGAGTVINVLKPDASTTIAVFGTGAVGMSALMAAKAIGAGRIVAIDRVESRLALARELGATDTIDTSKQDLGETLQAIGGVEQAIDTSGVPALIAAAVAALKERGTCVLLGASKDPMVTLNILPLISGRVIRGVVNGDCDPAVLIPQLVDWYLEGKFPVDRLSAFYALDEINKAVADSNSGKTIKPIILFEAA